MRVQVDPGDTYGWLTALFEIPSNCKRKNGETLRMVLVQCRCKKIRAVQLRMLREGARTSCGCKRGFDNRQPAPIDEEFFWLTVRSEAESTMGSTGQTIRWMNCECRCGGRAVRRLSSLRNGGAKSCGCSRKKTWAKKRIAGESAFNKYLYAHRSSAKRRGHISELSEDDVRAVSTQHCTYCGAPPSWVTQDNVGDGEFIHSEIDRLDPNLGYTLGNVTASCRACNLAKSNLSLTAFFEWIDRVQPSARSAHGLQLTELDNLTLFGVKPIDDPELYPPKPQPPYPHSMSVKVGMTFSCVEIIKLGPRGPRGAIAAVDVKCLLCGEVALGVRTVNVLRGNRRSCGCLERSGVGRQLPPGQAAATATYLNYKHNSAKARGFEWGISRGQFNAVSQMDCTYCGVGPSNCVLDPDGPGSFRYNGLDRVDPTRGYVAGNVTPACHQCNRAKSAMTPDVFDAWITRLKENADTVRSSDAVRRAMGNAN